MLFVHKFVDAALDRDPRHTLKVMEGTDRRNTSNLVRAAMEAEKFDFGELMLEKAADSPRYVLPDLTLDEKEMWIRGYLPLPAPICWYEYSIGGRRIGLLVTENDDPENPEASHPWVVMRVDCESDGYFWDGSLCALTRSEQDWTSDHWQYQRGGNPSASFTDRAADLMVSVYLTMMLNSRTTETRAEPAPERLNKARAKKGHTPLFEHRVVNVVPVRYIDDSKREVQGTHASPKLHWRRTHTRTLRRGQSNERKLVIWRHLVGRAELGRVLSHEYRVHGGER